MKDNSQIKQILKQIKKNKKYSSISDDIILNEIKNYQDKNKKLDLTKQTISKIRAELHKTYSSFQTKKKKKISSYLKELKNFKSKKQLLEITNNLLSTNISTKERLNSYTSFKLYKKIFNQTIKKPKTIIDLGSGFNIFSYPYMNLKKLNYYAYDIDNKDIKLINQYIKLMKNQGLNGKAKILDLKNIKKVSDIPPSDIIFLFKVIDIIDKENHKPSEELITQIFKKQKTKFIVASFATKTITRKKMNFPTRKWFELMLKRNNLNFKTIKTDNEIYYVVSP